LSVETDVAALVMLFGAISEMAPNASTVSSGRSGAVLWMKIDDVEESALNRPLAPTNSGADCWISMPVMSASTTPAGRTAWPFGPVLRANLTMPDAGLATSWTWPGAVAVASAAACAVVSVPAFRSDSVIATTPARRPCEPLAVSVTTRPDTVGSVWPTGVPAEPDSAVASIAWLSSFVVHRWFLRRSMTCWALGVKAKSALNVVKSAVVRQFALLRLSSKKLLRSPNRPLA